MNSPFSSCCHATLPRRYSGITLLDVSVLLVFLAVTISIAALERVRYQARDYAVSHGLELRQILNAALVHRYQTGEWPLNACSVAHLTTNDDCNGDGSGDNDDFSGLTALVEAGRLPNLPRYKDDNAARGGEWISLQPWSAATASVPTGGGLAALLASDSLRMETILDPSLIYPINYSAYIARLVPGTEVVYQGGEARLVSIVQFGGYSDILLSEIFDVADRSVGTVFTNQLVIARRVVLDAPQPGLLRVRPYLEEAYGGQVRVNLDGQRLGTSMDVAVVIGVSTTIVGVSVDGAAISSEVVSVSPAPALIFGVAALDTLGSHSDSGDRVELRALPDRLQIVEGVTARYLPDNLTLLRQQSLHDRPLLRALTINPNTGELIGSSTNNLRAYFAFPGDYTTTTITVIDGATTAAISIDLVAAASRIGELHTGATRTALLLGGVFDHPNMSPALFPSGAAIPPGASTRALSARRGDARVALALSVRYHSGSSPRLLGSLRGLLHEQLFLDEAPLVYPAGSDSLSIQELLDFCTLPELLSVTGSASCFDPTGAGAMFAIASQADDAAMVLPKLSLFFSDDGGLMDIGDGVSGRLELWADESTGHTGTVVREPGLHLRAAFSATGLSVGDYDGYANFSDARAPRAARVHLGLDADTDIYSYVDRASIPRQLTIQGTTSTNRSAWPVILGRVGTTTPVIDVIDFGGSTAGERTPLLLTQAADISLNMPLGLWYGASNHLVSGAANVRGLQISTLAVESIANLACWACADAASEGSSCPAPGSDPAPRYVCP